MNPTDKISPVILFAYNRLAHTRLTLESLCANSYASLSDLYVFLDGPKTAADKEIQSEILKLVNSFLKSFKSVKVVRRDLNIGLAQNILDGVTSVLAKYQSVIVLEDDLILSSKFLEYMNSALNYYHDNDSVYHISGYGFPAKGLSSDYFMLKHAFSWGWGTWSRAWENLITSDEELLDLVRKSGLMNEFNWEGNYDMEGQLIRNINSIKKTWAIKWYATIFLNKKLSLVPKKSYVQNIGLDGTGDNCGVTSKYNIDDLNDAVLAFKSVEVKECAKSRRVYNSFYKNIRKKSKMVSLRNFINKLLKYRSLFSKYTFDYLLSIHNDERRRRSVIKQNPGAHIHPKANISIGEVKNITFGTGVYIGAFTNITVNDGGQECLSNLKVGDGTYIGELNNIRAAGGQINIGRNCLISQGVTIVAANHSISKKDFITNQPWDVNKTGVLVEDDVWVGANVTILPGVTISKGAVIAAGSVVTKDVKPYTINAGNPTEIIKMRE